MSANSNDDAARAAAAVAQNLRIGHGYDLHRLEPIRPGGAAKPLVIGGVRFEHDLGPVGHSDGDALLHAVTDAILGSLALPDIGQLFSDEDPAHAGQSSAVFLARALELAAGRGFAVVNVDATVVLEKPKLGPAKDEIRRNLAGLLGIDAGRVNVKGKTHEKVDAIGEGRAIEVQCVVLMARV